MSPLRALVVDDSAAGRRILGRELERADFEVSYASDPFEALERVRDTRPDLIVTDFQMPGMDGVDLLARVREFSDVPVIVISAYGTIPVCERAMLHGAHRFLRLDEDIDDLGKIALSLLKPDPTEGSVPAVSTQAARERRDEDLRRKLESLVAECQGNISEIARRCGRDRSTVRYHLRRLGLWSTEDE